MEQFKIKFNNDWLCKGDILPSKKEKIKLKLKNLFRWLGFYKVYEVKVLSDPIQAYDGSYEYKVKIQKYKYYAFYILIWTKKYKTDVYE